MIKYADVIVDLQHGDSGKGKVANYIASMKDHTHVVRYNGSNNAGHTIYVDDKKVVTHSIPVGALHGIKSVIGHGCVLNVEHFFKELDELERIKPGVGALVKVSGSTHIVTDSHLAEDSCDTKIGTTRRGNGPAYRDKYDRKGVRARDVAELKDFIVDVYDEFFSGEECRILFEGAQGFYLDVDWGDYPYVTSSHCTVGSAVMNGVPPQKIRKVYGVIKAYETYVGSKSFEPAGDEFSLMRKIGNEYGATTGRARQCNWIDIDRVAKAASVNGVTHLVVNKVDVMRSIGSWNAYVDGNLVKFYGEDDFFNAICERVECDSIYWGSDPLTMGEERKRVTSQCR